MIMIMIMIMILIYDFDYKIHGIINYDIYNDNYINNLSLIDIDEKPNNLDEFINIKEDDLSTQ